MWTSHELSWHEHPDRPNKEAWRTVREMTDFPWQRAADSAQLAAYIREERERVRRGLAFWIGAPS